MNKWTAWYDSLPEHTRRYLDTRPVWHDRDMVWLAVLAFIIGIFVGKAL
jgi:hypothetical protein